MSIIKTSMYFKNNIKKAVQKIMLIFLIFDSSKKLQKFGNWTKTT